MAELSWLEITYSSVYEMMDHLLRAYFICNFGDKFFKKYRNIHLHEESELVQACFMNEEVLPFFGGVRWVLYLGTYKMLPPVLPPVTPARSSIIVNLINSADTPAGMRINLTSASIYPSKDIVNL